MHSLCLWSVTFGWAVRVVPPQLKLKERIKAQMVQLQGKCYQKVEPQSQQAALDSLCSPATCSGQCYKTCFSFRPWIPPEHIRVKRLDAEMIWTPSTRQAFVCCSSLILLSVLPLLSLIPSALAKVRAQPPAMLHSDDSQWCFTKSRTKMSVIK